VLLLDVNVVLAAHRDDLPQHAAMRRWLDDVIVAAEPFTVPTVVWASFLRLATNRRIFDPPTPLGDATLDRDFARFSSIDHVLPSPR
jgi:predicted nucleic acid-binding protein